MPIFISKEIRNFTEIPYESYMWKPWLSFHKDQIKILPKIFQDSLSVNLGRSTSFYKAYKFRIKLILPVNAIIWQQFLNLIYYFETLTLKICVIGLIYCSSLYITCTTSDKKRRSKYHLIPFEPEMYCPLRVYPISNYVQIRLIYFGSLPISRY